MSVYELRIYPARGHRWSEVLRVETFEADTPEAAEEHMRAFAYELSRTEQVFLWPQGGEHSIASEDGLA